MVAQAGRTAFGTGGSPPKAAFEARESVDEQIGGGPCAHTNDDLRSEHFFDQFEGGIGRLLFEFVLSQHGG